MYQTEFAGQHYELGTSGFLYRSNKLMYDHGTESMWSTLQGEPVVGPLVGKGIKLERGHVVTTTWGEWKNQHPDTLVLSLDTGHDRDYGEGVAYKEYFSNDKLMFQVTQRDDRLKNKDQVVALRDDTEQLAVAAKFLNENPVYHDQLGEKRFVILTTAGGANRVYESGQHQFVQWNGTDQVTDDQGKVWQVTEQAITQNETRLDRMPSHRAFWFGWYAQFPNTRLVGSDK